MSGLGRRILAILGYVPLLTLGMYVARTTSKLDKVQDGFIHYHSVSVFNLAMASFFFSFWNPRTPKTCITSPKSDVTSTVSYQASDDPIAETMVETYCSQDLYYSNQRTRNQFRPRNAGKGTTSYQLRQFAEATLGGGSLRKIVKLPEGEDENEWLAVNSELVLTGDHINVRSCQIQWSISIITSTFYMVQLQSFARRNLVLR
jgi:MOB kinase activator 1